MGAIPRPGRCLSEQGGARDSGNVAPPRRKSVARTARTRNSWQVQSMFRCANEELLASTELFRCHATFAANGETRLSIQTRIPCVGQCQPQAAIKELVHHPAYSEQE